MNIHREQLLLYAVTDRHLLAGRSLVLMVEEAILAGVTLIQYRDKELSFEERISEAILLHEVTKRYGVPLIMNDDLEAALMVKAEGVHLGQEDAAIEDARRKLGNDIIIGATAHNVEEALAAQASGADYIGAGALFGSATKNNTVPMSLATLTAICEAVTIPVVAIGGINEDNILTLEGSGICGVAVVSAIFGSKNITESTRTLNRMAKQISCQ